LMATMTASLSATCFPPKPPFTGPNAWKSDGSRSELHGGCGRTVHLNSAMVALSWCWYCCAEGEISLCPLAPLLKFVSSAS
jgi:hypothetical protein